MARQKPHRPGNLEDELDELAETDPSVRRANNSYQSMRQRLAGPRYGLTSAEIKAIYGDQRKDDAVEE